jgi:hypothetical protein
MTKELSNEKKWTLSFYTAIAALLVMNPYTFKFVNVITSKMGFSTSSNEGCPTVYGVLLHTIVFLLVIRLLMDQNTY